MGRALKTGVIALIGVSCGFGAKTIFASSEATVSSSSSTELSNREVGNRLNHEQFSGALAQPGSAQVTRVFELIDGMRSSSGCLQFATRLLNDPENSNSETLWALVFAKWAELDPQEMIEFAEARNDVRLRSLAWETWGATDPELLASKVESMGPPLNGAILKGIAERNPNLALAAAFKTAGVNSLIWSLFSEAPDIDEVVLREHLKKSVYDGMRGPISSHLARKLAERDPKEALSFVESQGRIWSDPKASLFGTMARDDPGQAASLLSEQPSSRSKAISAVQIAKSWALQDVDKSLEWVRSQSSAQVRDASLVAVASVIGGEDPERGLRLLEEVEWKDVGQFYSVGEVRNQGRVNDQVQEHDIAMTHHVGRALLENLARLDAEAARRYINTVVPEEMRALLSNIAEPPKSE